MTPNYYQSLLLDLNHEDQTQLNGHYLSLKHQEVDVIFHGAPSYTALEVKREEENHHQSCSSRSSVKWMSSKTRLLRKMMMTSSATNNPKKFKFEDDHNFKHVTSANKESSAKNSTDNNSPPVIRTCADCKTTTTPLWRSGPQGPKSLCNACGIRQRKARRAAMAAASGMACISNNNTKKLNLHKETGSKQTKKRPKNCVKPVIGNPTPIRKLCFEEFALRLSKKLSLHHVFPPDEKDAAILLMALSCGLVEG